MFKKVGKKIQTIGTIMFIIFTLGGLIVAVIGLREASYHSFPSWDFFDFGGFFSLGGLIGGPIIGYLIALIFHGFGIIVTSHETDEK